MAVKAAEWESELWSCVSNGGGEHCPLYSQCRYRLDGHWCTDDNGERLKRLSDDRCLNLSNYEFIKSGRPFGIFELVTSLANKYLKRGGIRNPPVPTELVQLADEQYPIEVHQLPLIAHHGSVWRLKEKWIIQLREDDPSAKKRFTIFHEAFHILAHCRANHVFKKRETRRGSFNELLADYFAVCVLIPREWVKERWAEVKDLDKMAKIFDVPKPVMCIRLKRMGLL